MGAVNFYLKKKEESTGNCLIYLQYKYNGYKLTFSFGQTINPANWNKTKQRVKSNKATTADGQYSLNDLLDNLELECKSAYHKELKNGIPQPETIKKHLVSFINQNEKGEDAPTLFKLIERFKKGEIKHKGKEKASGTLMKYTTICNYLQAFEAKTRYKIDFNTINLDFFYKFVSFLREKGLAQNTIAKQIDHIKTFMNEALDQGLTTNIQHKNKKFTVSWEESESLYLTEPEILHLYKHDLSSSKKLEQVRDLFVFGCFVGLRFSDYSDVKPENIITIDGQKFIDIKARKTGERVIIPCNPIVLQIFDKYKANSNKLPKTISNQKFNQYVKNACKEANMTEKGRLMENPEKELWECISSHTARRSFATNLYLEGYPTVEIMKITGHRTEAAFLTYLKVSKLDAAKRLSKHMQLRWSEKLLKAV
jgi:integrase